MRLRLVTAAVAVLAIVGVAAPFASAVDVTSATAAIAATPLDGTRSIDTVGFATVTLTGARSDMTGTLGVRVVEATRTGNPTIRVQVASSDLTCGATVTAPKNTLSVSGRTGTVGYLTGQTTPLGASTAIVGSSALGDGLNASTPADVFLVAGESASVAYTTAATPHVANGTLHFVVPTNVPAAACAGTLSYTMLYV